MSKFVKEGVLEDYSELKDYFSDRVGKFAISREELERRKLCVRRCRGFVMGGDKPEDLYDWYWGDE